MISFPNAKINIGLQILNKRSDGYHNLETLFLPVPLCDILEIIKIEDSGSNSFSDINLQLINQREEIQLNNSLEVDFVVSGYDIGGQLSANLCIEAFKKYNDYRPLKGKYFMHLHKIIPSGAGLGGGSSDGSFTLKMINSIQEKPLETELMQEIASRLGSDCAALLINKPVLGNGRGEVLENLDFSLSGYILVIVKPPVHINTSQAFSKVIPKERTSEEGIMKLIQLPPERWKDKIVNDFEQLVFTQSKEIGKIKSDLYNSGAVYASLTGSGSAVYGIFNKAVGDLNFPESYFYFETVL